MASALVADGLLWEADGTGYELARIIKTHHPWGTLDTRAVAKLAALLLPDSLSGKDSLANSMATGAVGSADGCLPTGPRDSQSRPAHPLSG